MALALRLSGYVVNVLVEHFIDQLVLLLQSNQVLIAIQGDIHANKLIDQSHVADQRAVVIDKASLLIGHMGLQPLDSETDSFSQIESLCVLLLLDQLHQLGKKTKELIAPRGPVRLIFVLNGNLSRERVHHQIQEPE